MNIYRILDIPFVYRLSQFVLAPAKPLFMKKIWESAFDVSLSPVLDVGCGPSLIGPRPSGKLYGVDINSRYLESYLRESFSTKNKNNQETIVKEGSSICLPFDDGFFLEVRANGFLHHLTDKDVSLTDKEMYRCLAPGGQLVILEDVWPESIYKRPLAWLIRKFDQGQFMRTEEQLVTLFSNAIGEPAIIQRHTYTLIGTELCFLKWMK